MGNGAYKSKVLACIAQRFGRERSLYYAIWFMLIGVGLRSLPHLAALYVGNNIIAVGIALGNVLLPGLILSCDCRDDANQWFICWARSADSSLKLKQPVFFTQVGQGCGMLALMR